MDSAVLEGRLRQGRFLEAVDSIKGRRLSEFKDPWLLSLAAEALERTGQVPDADAAVNEVHRRGSTGTRAFVRALIVKGILELEADKANDSVATLEKALAISTQAGYLDEQCWSRLRLLLASFEVNEDLDLDAEVIDVRRNVELLPDTAAIIGLHVFASEIYAKRGLLRVARSHLAIAQDLNRTRENPWLGGLIAISTFCLRYLEMDYLAAEAAAKNALHLSRVSGHLRGEFAAVIDLAHVWIRLGRFDEAALMLRRASNMCDLSPRCWDCVRDGIAQLELNTGNLGNGRLLVEQVLASGTRPHAYARLWSSLTKAEMLLRQGLYKECREQCIGTLEAMPKQADKGLTLRLRLTLAEAFARSGSFSEAGHVAAVARRDVGDTSAGLLSEVNHRIASILALGGLAFQAQALAERANRLSAALGAPTGLVSSIDRVGSTMPAVISEEVVNRAGDAFGRVLDRTAALFEQAMHPECAALELGHLVGDLGCCNRWAVVQVRGFHLTVLKASHAFSTVELAEFSMSKTTLVTEWSGSRGTQIRVMAEPVPSLEAIDSISRLLKIAQYAAAHTTPLAVSDDEDFQGTPGSAEMARVLQLARRVAETDVPVLLLGETGVGKEWLAIRIHEWSKRRAKFIGFNCAAVSRELVEAQLFGHRRGAFTGAIDSSVGVIRAADGGTVLLDEIAEASLESQAKLLRFLETGEVHAVGDVLPKKANARVIAATNRRLEELRSAGVMRPDLFYRLSVLRMEIPALRHRKGEIVPIAEDSLVRFARQFGKSPLHFSSDCREALVSCDWPGNVRQLVNEIRRAAALANAGGIITSRDLSEDIVGSSLSRQLGPRPPQVEISLNQPLSNATEELERASIAHARRLCDGRREQMAALLGLSRKGLYLKCLRLGLEGDSRPEVGQLRDGRN